MPPGKGKHINRSFKSCVPCRDKKVKCDRVKPCEACCSSGNPSDCEYAVNGEDLGYITQAAAIESLRLELEKLKKRLQEIEQNGRSPPSLPSRQATQDPTVLEEFYNTLMSASPDEVNHIVARVRNGIDLERIVTDATKNRHKGIKKGVSAPCVPRQRRLIPKPPPTRIMATPNPGRVVEELALERFLDSFSPDPKIHPDSHRALRLAAHARTSSRLLSDAYRATSIALFGQTISNQSAIQAARRMYGNVLKDLQRAIYHPEDSKSMSVLLTTALLFIWEAIQHTARGSVLAHWSGILKLFEHRGPESHMFGVEHLYFVELRFYSVVAALAARRPSFLATMEWKTVPWSSGSTNKDIVQYLFDEVLELPAYLEQYDRFQRLIGSSASPIEITSTHTCLSSWATKIEQRLFAWYKRWVDNYPGGKPVEHISHSDNSFPLFRCRGTDTQVIIVPTIFMYPDFTLALALCIYYAACLILARSDVRTVGFMHPDIRYQFACKICRSMEYCFRTSPGQSISRIAFTLRVAYEFLPEGVERQYVREFCALVVAKYRLRIWENIGNIPF